MYPTFKIKAANNCDKCWKKCVAGSVMIKTKRERFWCLECAKYLEKYTADYDQTCRRCGVKIKAGCQMGWAPLLGSWCYHCANGKDSIAAKLSTADRDEMQQLMDEFRKYSMLVRPLQPSTEEQAAKTLTLLKKKFGHIPTVEKLLAKFI